MSWLNTLRRNPTDKSSSTSAPLTLAPSADDAPESCVAAICQAADKAQALTWVAALEGDRWLGEVAVHGSLADVRLAAAQRLTETAILTQVAHSSRNKDKRVYRHCSDLLRRRQQTSERERQATGLNAALKELLDSASISLTQLLILEKQMQALDTEAAPSPIEQEAQQLLEQARQRLHDESIARRDLQSSEADAQALQGEITASAGPTPDQLADWQARHQRLNECSLQLPAWLISEPAAKKLTAALHGIQQRLASMAEDQLRLQSAPIPAQEKPAPPAIDKKNIQHLLEKLEYSVSQGLLAEADVICKQLETAQGGASLDHASEARLKSLQAQLTELHRWARWGTEQARENLIAEAEKLLVDVPAVDELARAISRLREEWKKLNSFGHVAKARWERFDTTLTRAYQPVATHRAEEAARQAAAGKAKAALCAEGDAYLATLDWEKADYARLEIKRQDMLKQWRASGLASFRDERALRKRHDALIRTFDAKFAEVRGREAVRCEQLISAAEAIASAANPGHAIAEIKKLQDRWTRQRGPLRLNKSDEQRLWRRFHSACDAAFTQRNAQRSQLAAERAEQRLQRQSLLDSFAAALANADENAVRLAMSQFQKSWTAGMPSQEEDKPLAARAKELQDKAAQRLDALTREKRRSYSDLLLQKAGLAESIEVAAVAHEPLDPLIQTIKKTWDALPRLPGKAEQRLAQRLAKAATATDASLTLGHKERDSLLLDLEHKLGLPSPEVAPEQHRQRQLERLQNRFAGGGQVSSDPAALVLDWYAIAAHPDSVQNQRMASVQRVLEDRHAKLARPG